MNIKYEGSAPEYSYSCNKNVMIPLRDGIKLATDIYFPSQNGKIVPKKFPIILERTPYGKSIDENVLNGQFFAKRGYVCAIQDVRGRFNSEGEWYPFALEAPDGYDTVEWLASQEWSNGKIGTMGQSYGGSDQSALATLNPPHLSTMIVAVGASNYFHSSMRHNGTLEQRFLIYALRMAITSKEASNNANLRESLIQTYTENLHDFIKDFPIKKGDTILSNLPSYEQWAFDISTHGEYTDYWKQRGYGISDYYTNHSDIPTLYLGGWYDSYARNTCESFIALNKMKKSHQALLMGPWIHAKYEVTFAGDLDFGEESHINYNDTRLHWFDSYLKNMKTEVADWSPVRIFTMGTGTKKRLPNIDKRINYGGYWRNEKTWPVPGMKLTKFYLHGDRTLSQKKNYNPEAPKKTSYTFDPYNPVPTIGGGISAVDIVMVPGPCSQHGRNDFIGCTDELPLHTRNDIITFETPVLSKDLEITGPIYISLWISSTAIDTDFTAKIVDVFPNRNDDRDGIYINITDSIIRTRYRDSWKNPSMMTPGEIYQIKFQLYPTSVVFQKNHKLRLDISSSNWPRFDVNPNTGNPSGTIETYLSANQTIFHQKEYPSHLILPVK